MNTPTNRQRETFISCLFLCVPIALLYSLFLWNPVVFDDEYFFDGSVHHQYLDKIFSSDLRWLPYATFEWTRRLFGLDLIWFRLGNLLLHLATAITLFLFLRRLFEQVLANDSQNKTVLSPHWLAFFAALIFALHPVSVYAVAYLTQRTTLMATLFTLLTWRFFLEGLIRENRVWLTASAVAYLFAALAKEHAVMTPAVCVAILLLIKNQPIRQYLKLIWPTFVLYALIGAFVVLQVKAHNVLGQSPEIMASTMIPRLGNDFDNNLIYPLSIITQSFLFFKYLLLWVVPSTTSMSVDMYQDFALRLWSWPQIAGLIGFITYGFLAFYLLLQKGLKGLLGFALVCPWLLFFTEFSSVRIQETFVLYRSYLWMAGAFATLPFLCQKLSAKQATWALLAVALFMTPLSLLKLKTFSHSFLLWDDAARLAERNGEYHVGMERIYYNRGVEFMQLKMYTEAIEDYTKALKLGGESSYSTSYLYQNRGVMYLKNHQYSLALSDFDKVINYQPKVSQERLDKVIAGKTQALKEQNESNQVLEK